MKRLLAAIGTAVLLLTSLPSYAAAAAEFVTGQDWLEHMSLREKYMSLVTPTVLFAEYDVHVKLALPQYIHVMDRIMERNPGLRGEEVSSIFASTIYMLEPENRAALKTMEMDYLKGDFEPPLPAAPQLTVEEVLNEAKPAVEA